MVQHQASIDHSKLLIEQQGQPAMTDNEALIYQLVGLKRKSETRNIEKSNHCRYLTRRDCRFPSDAFLAA